MILIYLGTLVIIVPLWYVWDWWTDGTISAGEAVALSAVLFAVLGQMAAFHSPGLQTALFILLLASAVLMPVIAGTVENVAQNKFKTEQIATYRMAIANDPMNVAARVQLARTLYGADKLDEAIAEMEAAFALSRLSYEEARLLADWKEERRIRDTRNVFCPACGKENEHGSKVCLKCGRPLARGFAADWARTGGPGAAVRAWALAVGCVMAVLFAFAIFPSLPSPHPLIVTVAGFLAWLAFYTLSRRKSRR
jgi:hypothetical protein